MVGNKYFISRRKFLKTAGAVGVGSMLSPVDALTHAQTKPVSSESESKVVPTRSFGRTGVEVPILGFGSYFADSSDLLKKQALKLGVRLWETAATYSGGNEEEAVGKYFAKYPQDREKVFLVTKSYAMNAEDWSTDLNRSLKKMNTSYVDLFLIHAVAHAEDIAPPAENSELWAEKAKSEGKIRFFGFSTHAHMEDNLMKGSQYGWIDGIMFSYNIRIMNNKKMKAAVDACTKAGIGLIAMKTQATDWYGRRRKIKPDAAEQALFDRLTKKGMTIEQAKLKAVWDDQRIASISSLMKNMAVLQANVAAALNDQKLSWRDKHLFDQYAHQTASSYCAGCASICESAINSKVPISDIMRYLMYARCYGELAKAKALFNDLSSTIRNSLVHIDYRKAEQKCPQRMEIGRLMRQAATELA